MRGGRGAETIGMREGGGGETGFMGNFSKIMNVKVGPSSRTCLSLFDHWPVELNVASFDLLLPKAAAAE